MVAMVLTAISYGRMASLYPSAGSAYTYVSRGIHPYIGFAAGWAMLLDYIVIPLFCVIYGTLSLQRALPWLPFFAGSALFAGGITMLNLRGIRATARNNQILLFLMFTVLGAFLIFAVRYLWMRQGFAGLFSSAPFYNPATFSVRRIAQTTSFAALTYLGFDSVTTLAEEVENPRRNVLLAAVGVCLFTGLFGGLLVYFGQLAWPDYNSFRNPDTAFIDVTGRVGGPLLLQATAMMLVVANIGAGLTSQVGAARLLFGMGREKVLPPRIFARLHPVHNTPDLNVILIGIVAFLGAQFMSYELTAECPQLRRLPRLHGSQRGGPLAIRRPQSCRPSQKSNLRHGSSLPRLPLLRSHLVGTCRPREDRRQRLAGGRDRRPRLAYRVVSQAAQAARPVDLRVSKSERKLIKMGEGL